MNWLLLAFATSLIWGIGQVLVKKGLSVVSPFLNNTMAVIFALTIQIPYALSGGITWNHFPTIFLLGLLANLPTFFIPYVIKKTNVSLSGTILASYPIYTIFLSIIFLKEKLGTTQILGIIAITIGMLFVSKVKTNKLIIKKGILLAIIGSIILGVGFFISKFSIMKYGLYTYILAASLSNIPSLFLTRLVDKSHINLKFDKKIFAISLLGNFLMPLGVLFLYIAFSRGPASLISPIISIYPAITVVLAYFYLKERIQKTNMYGIIAVIIGVICLTIK
ncbi:MAG: DMT family transporter [Candidatus Woesebacteria bacterium]|nr:DMT family transporter [Candidatus Woesebacteria bacterium]